MPKSNEAYIAELETEKGQLLTQLENYAQEQKAKVIIFRNQEQLLAERNKQLVAQEEQLSESEELITKLKARIQELAKLKKIYTTTIHSDNKSEEEKAPKKVNIAVQTEGVSPSELEEQLLEKRLTNLQDFGAYREQLQSQDHLISKLQQRVIAYQRKIKTLPYHTNQQEKNAIIIFLLVVLTSTLFFK